MLEDMRGQHAGEHLYIIGKGPSLRAFQPFDQFRGQTCIGINNVYKYFPHCSHVLLWHAEMYWSDQEFLETQKQFELIYSSFHNLPAGLPNAIDVPYIQEHALPEFPEGHLDYWDTHPDEWMFKSTFATAVKLCWWMGASRITLVGFDFSLANGRTADDSSLHIDVPLRNYTVPQILDLHAQQFAHLRTQLATRGVILERVFDPAELSL